MAESRRSRGALELKAGLVPFQRDVVQPIQEFLRVQWVGSAILLAAAVVAMVWANSPWSELYFRILHLELEVDLGFIHVQEDLQHLINDALMAVFFFVVGLEMKRELLHGGLSDRSTAALPAVAALGGMVVPAALYFAVNPSGPAQAGWGVPMATDIAFALGVVGLVGKGIPFQVRLFLLALAIVDDLGAILVIALFYTDTVSVDALIRGAAILVGILVMQRTGVRSIAAYWLVGALFWVQILESGIHATIAGVIMGAVTPSRPAFTGREYLDRSERLLAEIRTATDDEDHGRLEAALGAMELSTIETESPLERLERKTHPWSAYLILPVFALANAGVTVNGSALASALASPVTLGIVLGLLVGKVAGIFGFSFVAVKLGWAQLPAGVRWLHIAGAGILAGIGFTMSIFITGLAFNDPDLINEAKMGVLVASLVAGTVGYAFLKATGRSGPPGEDEVPRKA